MSMFICQRCDQMRDSDDGCTEGSNFGLICEQCMNEAEDDEETFHTSDSSATEYQRVERMRHDMSYEGIKSKLLEMGCPPDIAEELAREKSR